MALDPLEGLDPEQREVATTVGEPVCVIAGAGTGKTRAITHRIAYAVHTGHADPTRSLALTFTTRAAAELRRRLDALGVEDVQARTFHAAALRQLRYFWPRVEGGALPTLVPSKAGYASQAARRLGIADSMVADLIAEIEWAKVSLISPEEFASSVGSRNTPIERDEMAEFYQVYESIKAADGAIDFEDVLLLAIGLMAENSAVAEQVREQYRHFTVDEYQDVSPLQQQLLDLWVSDRDDVCVVGDPQQTIYSFAGATSDFLRSFAERHDAKVVRLFRDYRSTPQIVDFANRLVPVDHHLIGQQEAGPRPDVIAVQGDEPALLANRVREAIHDGAAPADIAVLFRTNAQAEGFARVLRARGVPASVRRSESDDSEIEGVTVASLHAAKGLEWDRVFIGGVIEGLLPISYATDEAAIAEEKRLFYVGVTRARRHLVITYEGSRSRFLDEVFQVATATTSAAMPSAKPVTVASCRQCGRPLGSAAARKRGRCDACPGAPDPAVREALVQWRGVVSAREGMPEFVVATDATLDALAEVLPTTLEALKEVVGPRKAHQYGEELLLLIRG